MPDNKRTTSLVNHRLGERQWRPPHQSGVYVVLNGTWHLRHADRCAIGGSCRLDERWRLSYSRVSRVAPMSSFSGILNTTRLDLTRLMFEVSNTGDT